MAHRLRRCLDSYRLRRERSRGFAFPGNAESYPLVVDEQLTEYIQGDMGPLFGPSNFFTGGNWTDDSGIGPGQYFLSTAFTANPAPPNPPINGRIDADSSTPNVGLIRSFHYNVVTGNNIDRKQGFVFNVPITFSDPAVNGGNYFVLFSFDNATQIQITPITANNLDITNGGDDYTINFKLGVPVHFKFFCKPNGIMEAYANDVFIGTLHYAPLVNSANPIIAIQMLFNTIVGLVTVSIGRMQYRGYRK